MEWPDYNRPGGAPFIWPGHSCMVCMMTLVGNAKMSRSVLGSVRDAVNVLPYPGRRVPCYIDGLQALICVQVVEEIYILEEKKYKR